LAPGLGFPADACPPRLGNNICSNPIVREPKLITTRCPDFNYAFIHVPLRCQPDNPAYTQCHYSSSECFYDVRSIVPSFFSRLKIRTVSCRVQEPWPPLAFRSAFAPPRWSRITFNSLSNRCNDVTAFDEGLTFLNLRIVPTGCSVPSQDSLIWTRTRTMTPILVHTFGLLLRKNLYLKCELRLVMPVFLSRIAPRGNF
jgi:hypothetical protein